MSEPNGGEQPPFDFNAPGSYLEFLTDVERIRVNIPPGTFHRWMAEVLSVHPGIPFTNEDLAHVVAPSKILLNRRSTLNQMSQIIGGYQVPDLLASVGQRLVRQTAPSISGKGRGRDTWTSVHEGAPDPYQSYSDLRLSIIDLLTISRGLYLEEEQRQAQEIFAPMPAERFWPLDSPVGRPELREGMLADWGVEMYMANPGRPFTDEDIAKVLFAEDFDDDPEGCTEKARNKINDWWFRAAFNRSILERDHHLCRILRPTEDIRRITFVLPDGFTAEGMDDLGPSFSDEELLEIAQSLRKDELLLQEERAEQPESKGSGLLTACESKILNLLSEGNKIPEMAEITSASKYSVKSAIKRLGRRYHVPAKAARIVREAYVHQDLTEEVVSEVFPTFSQLNREIMELVSLGLSNDEIASLLLIDSSDVTGIISTLSDTFNAKTRAHLTKIGIEKGLIIVTYTEAEILARYQVDIAPREEPDEPKKPKKGLIYQRRQKPEKPITPLSLSARAKAILDEEIDLDAKLKNILFVVACEDLAQLAKALNQAPGQTFEAQITALIDRLEAQVATNKEQQKAKLGPAAWARQERERRRAKLLRDRGGDKPLELPDANRPLRDVELPEDFQGGSSGRLERFW